MVCCLYVGIYFGVAPHHMPDHVVTLARHTRPHNIEAVGWGPAALALEDPENATEHKNQASTMTPVSGVVFSISIALGVHLTTFYTNLSRIFAAWQD